MASRKRRHSDSGSNTQPANTAGAVEARPQIIDCHTADDGDCNDSVEDEYDRYSDTSDEEDIRNAVGNIPMNWYDDYNHVGYNWDGEQLLKPATGDQLDAFLRSVEDPNFWRTVYDTQTGQRVVLSDEDLKIIRRIKTQQYPDGQFNDCEPWVEWFTSQVEAMPLRKFPEHKRSFLPSTSDQKKIQQLVYKLKMGWIKTRAELKREQEEKRNQCRFYDLWGAASGTEDDAQMRRIHKHIPAPKRPLPTHVESYNPPAEYLFDEREMKQWLKAKDTPWKRKLHYVPKKYSSLRQVPSYQGFIRERFMRCLDLYLCPRAIHMKLDSSIQAEDLVPKLPRPEDLQPFPSMLAVEFRGHESGVRCISVDVSGQYLVSGCLAGELRVWEVNTGRCLKVMRGFDQSSQTSSDDDNSIRSVAWCPNKTINLILVAHGRHIFIVNPHVGDFLVCLKTDTVLDEVKLNDETSKDANDAESDAANSTFKPSAVSWHVGAGAFSTPDSKTDDLLTLKMRLDVGWEVHQVVWHRLGDYFASVAPDAGSKAVSIHQLSRHRSELPLGKNHGRVQCVQFHPNKPILFVATQRYVNIYNLMNQHLVKKLRTNAKWISSMSIHAGGDNVLVGTYDSKMMWFDLDMTPKKPYQVLRLHSGHAVRCVAFHARYPLFASGGDDRSVIVSHGMVYNDILQNALIVPLKRFEDHKTVDDLAVLDVLWHSKQPWVFSCGADGTIKLYTN